MSFSLIALCPFPCGSCQEEKSILNSLYINQYGSTRQASTFSFTERLLRWSMVKFNNLWQPYSIQRNHPAAWDHQFLSVRLDSSVCYILALLLSIPRSSTSQASQVSKSISIRSRNAFQVTGATVAAHSTGVLGFEPRNDGVRVRCLTFWLYPNKLDAIWI